MGYYHLDGILSESSLHQLKHTLCEGFVKLDVTIIFSVNQKFVEQDATNSQWHLAHVKCEYYQVLECEYSEQLNLFQIFYEIHAHVKIIESHAYTMPTISEVHHVYTEPITTI